MLETVVEAAPGVHGKTETEMSHVSKTATSTCLERIGEEQERDGMTKLDGVEVQPPARRREDARARK